MVFLVWIQVVKILARAGLEDLEHWFMFFSARLCACARHGKILENALNPLNVLSH